MQKPLVFLAFVILISCIEPYTFEIKDNDPLLVIEGLISDKSFDETLDYPSDGRHFTIKLSTTNNVKNVRPTPVTNAVVKVEVENESEHFFDQSPGKPGIYQLLEHDFKAVPGKRYRVSITAGEEVYQSEWQSLPDETVPPIGTVTFEEATAQRYVLEANEKVLKTIKQIETSITVPRNTSGEPIYYRWEFTPTWIFTAPLSPSVTRPGYRCWATSTNYLSSYVLQEDRAGNYVKELFSVDTENNERIWDNLSVLVSQYAMSEENYYFWKEMQDQVQGNTLADKPPFNLKTNIYSVYENQRRAIGYFSVVQEQAVRWYFSKDMLSYMVDYTFKKGCEIIYGPPLPGCPEPTPGFPACECKYCLDYSNGETTNIKPSWWPM